MEEQMIQETVPKWQMWLKIESFREDLHQLPWRPDTTKDASEEDCEDLDRLVLFDDISPALFRIDVTEKFKLIIHFIQFLGFDYRSASNVIYPEYNTSESSIENVHEIFGDRHPELDFLDYQNNNIPDSLKQLIINVLRQCIDAFNGHEKTNLTSLLIHFELIIRTTNKTDLSKGKLKELRKLVKELLKEEHNRNNLYIWNRYAILEHEIGKTEESLKILETALTMFSGNVQNAADSKLALSKLYNTYIEVLLGFNNNCVYGHTVLNTNNTSESITKAMNALDSCIEGSQFSNKETAVHGTQILKLKKRVESLEEKALLFDAELSTDLNIQNSFEILKNITWFEYCRNGIKTATEFLDNCVCKCKSCYEDNEGSSVGLKTFYFLLMRRILKFYAQLTIYNMKVESQPLKHLRLIIQKSLKLFPNDTYFLHLFIEVEQNSHIEGRLHSYFSSVIKHSDTPVSSIFAVIAEIWHQQLIEKQYTSVDYNGEVLIEIPAIHTGIVHKVRALMEAALNRSGVRNCPLVWRLYLQFEAKYGTMSRAKGLFYRALHQCPWSKVLYKDGVRIFGEEQLQETVDLMMEKEIRVQIPVEELDILLEK